MGQVPPKSSKPAGEFIARVHTSPIKPLPYRLFVPAKVDREKKYPLLVWLHGAGGLGTDNARQIEGDQIPGTHWWTTAERQAEQPAFVLAPQTDRVWVAERDSAALSPDLSVVLEILDAVGKEFPIDSSRVYVLGQSVGGRGVWNLVSNKPERFAAAVLLCPQPGDISRAASVATLPFWIFQGADDVAPFVAGSRALVAALKAAGGSPRYTEYPHVRHDVWTRVFQEPGLARWLFSQRRK